MCLCKISKGKLYEQHFMPHATTYAYMFISLLANPMLHLVEHATHQNFHLSFIFYPPDCCTFLLYEWWKTKLSTQIYLGFMFMGRVFDAANSNFFSRQQSTSLPIHTHTHTLRYAEIQFSYSVSQPNQPFRLKSSPKGICWCHRL